MKTARFLSATLCALALSPAIHASSLFVSYSTSTGGGVEMFSLSPQSPGTLFDSENAAVTSLAVANNSAWWVSATHVFSDSLNDTTGGTHKATLPGIPLAGITITDLDVAPSINSYLVGWDAPGYGWFIGQYPIVPNGSYSVFVNATAPIHGLTVVGNLAYWTEGNKIWSQKLDGTGKSLVQSFNFGTVTLPDLAVDPATQSYLLAATTPGLSIVGRYPLTPNSSGTVFNFPINPVKALTIAGTRAWWIDGSNVWSENLNGTDLQLQQTFNSSFTLTDLAVSLTPAADAVPEPASSGLLGAGLFTLGAVLRRRRGAR